MVDGANGIIVPINRIQPDAHLVREVCEKCILLVDDDPAIRKLLSIHLKKVGFQAFHAEDGIDALQKLRDRLPKVIISDLAMPRMSGQEFIGVVRRRFPTIPVVALTGSITRDFPAEAKPDRCFEKTVRQIPDFLQAVHDLVREAPNDVYLPQVISIPVRTGPGFAGYLMLTCTDCLRTFRATTAVGDNAEVGTGVCTYCEAHVPFQIESSHPD